MCYLSLAFNTIFVLVFLGLFYSYVRFRLNIQIPLILLALVFLALQVDALETFSACMAGSLDQCSTTSLHT